MRRSSSMKIMGIRDRDDSRTSLICRWLNMSNNLTRQIIAACMVFATMCASTALLAQTSGTQPQAPPPAADQKPVDQKQDQNIPDAPSAVQPPKSAPETPPAQEPTQEQAPSAPAANEPPPQEAAPDTSPNPVQKPPVNIRTVPQGGATKVSGGQEEFFKITVQANQVMVPVTVKDESGRLVNGLLAKDFNVLENGKKQTLNFFTSDPFALSAAVILDLGMKDVDVQRVARSFPALEGSFSQFDEVSIYSYSNAVSKLSDWAAVGQKFTDTLRILAAARGRNNGPPVTSGPLGPQGPTINNMPLDPGSPTVYTPAQESHVLNDAILLAAMELARRDKARRKVIFVISDGREY